MFTVLGQLFLVFALSVFVVATEHNSNHTMNWKDAVQFCGKIGMVLRKSKLSLYEISLGKYWTRIYQRESDLIYLYGCLNAHDVSKSENMTKSRCIEECMNKGSHLFVLQNNGCSCLSNPHPNLQQQCDLNSSPLVFGTIGTETNGKKEHCLQIDCQNKGKAEFVQCDEGANIICGNEEILGNFTWKSAADECNKRNGTRNFESNKVCDQGNNNTEKRNWFHFGTYTYIDEYIKFNAVSDVNLKRCQSCEENCQFDDCNEKRIAACEKTMESEKGTMTTDKKHMTTKEMRNQITKDMYQATNDMHDHTTIAATNIQDTQDKTTKIILKHITEVVWDTTTGVKPPHEAGIGDPGNVVVIYCVSILVPVLNLLILFLLYLRCRHQKKHALQKESDIPNNTQTETTGLKTELYELADNSKLDFSDPNHTVVKTTDASTYKEPDGNRGSIGRDTHVPVACTIEDVYNHLCEKPVDCSSGIENIYNHCNPGREDISEYGVTSYRQSNSAILNSNYDHVRPAVQT